MRRYLIYVVLSLVLFISGFASAWALRPGGGEARIYNNLGR